MASWLADNARACCPPCAACRRDRVRAGAHGGAYPTHDAAAGEAALTAFEDGLWGRNDVFPFFSSGMSASFPVL
jgi:hypothetical protein